MDLSIIKKGIILNNYVEGVSKKFTVCSCGQVDNYKYWKNTCSKCGNTDFIDPSYTELKENRVAMGGVYQVISKDNTGFVIERSDVYAKVDVDNLKFNLTQQSIVYKADFSFKRGNVLVYKNNEKIYASEYHLDCVFRNLNYIKLIEDFSTPQNKAVFSVAYNKYGRENNERVNKMSRALKRLLEVPALQTLGAYGLTERTLKEVASEVKCTTETKPHLILGFPKYQMELIRQYKIDVDSKSRTALFRMNTNFDGTTVKQYFKIFDEENTVANGLSSVDNIIALYNDYGYTDIAKLATYATRDVKLQQGITDPNNALTLLRDYIKMMKALEHSYEKYPKSLKKVHDIAMMNYKVVENEVKDKAFRDIVEQKTYQNLLYNDKTYGIIIPECVKDIIREGDSLSHCVASYVDDVIKEKCRLVFLRYKETPEESLITIEIRNQAIRQVKGKGNRKPIVEEVEFVKAWSKKKGLEINCYDISGV